MIELIILYISIGFIIIATCYYTVTKNHFEKRDMIHVPRQWFIGSMGGYVYSNFAYSDFIRHLYTMIRMDAKYFGYYDHSTPIIMIRDPEIIRNIKVINFSHFTDRPNPHNEALDVIFAKNLRYMKGDQWQRMRDILNPAFSPLRIAVMFDELSACAENFAGFFLNENQKPEVDMDDAFYKLACDMVGRAAFGIEPDSLRQPVNELIYLGTKCTSLEDNFSLIKIFIIDKFPSIAKLFNIRISQPEFTQKFTDAVKDIIEFRKNKGIVRHDMIQLMVNARDKGDFPLTMDEIVTQASLFFSDGLEVVTTIMCFVTYLIAVSPEAQVKLRKEIDETHEMCGGKLTYAILNGMPYLEAVIYETLRMYPYEPVITRVCTKTYDLPPCFPDDQAPQVLIPGDIVAFPVCGLHRDPKHFPEPDSFDPERFIKNATETYLNPVYMPFGLGPRSCIGMRLAMLEVKLMLYHLLLKLTLEPAKRMIVPLRLQYGTIPPTAQGGFWLKIRSRDEGANLAFNSGTEEEEEEEAEAALSSNL